MASSVSSGATQQNAEPVSKSDVMNRLGRRIFVIDSNKILTSATPTALTIYEVPAGRVFYMTSYIAYTTDAGSQWLECYDNIDNTASGTQFNMFIRATTLGPVKIPFDTPMVLKKGFTLSTTGQPASKEIYLQIEGYLL